MELSRRVEGCALFILYLYISDPYYANGEGRGRAWRKGMRAGREPPGAQGIQATSEH